MKRYEFKDSRLIFKWINLAMAITILKNILYVFTFNRTDLMYSPIPIAVISSIVPVIVLLVFRSYTTANVYAYEDKISCGKTIYYMMITEITAGQEIIIKADSNWMTIKLIDIETNFEKYEELLTHILGKVDAKVAAKTGNAKQLLNALMNERKTRYASKKSENGKVELGGWLTWFNISAYLGCISGVFLILGSLVALATSDTIPYINLVQQLPVVVISVFTVIALEKRRANVKYWLAALPAATLPYTILRAVEGITGNNNMFVIILTAISILLSIIYAALIAKAQLYYIDNFDRPKQTLVN